jgi:tetratricopeptide (TPR) repeat protein
METNQFIRPNGPSHVLLQQIFDHSEYHSRLMNRAVVLKDQILKENDPPALLRINTELNIIMNRQSRLMEYAGEILDVFRTIPYRSRRLDLAEEYFFLGQFDKMDEALDHAAILQEASVLQKEFASRKKGGKTKMPVRSSLSYELLIKSYYHYSHVENPKWYETVYEYLSDAYKIQPNAHTSYGMAFYFRQSGEALDAFEMASQIFDLVDVLDYEANMLYKAKAYWVKSLLLRERNMDIQASDHCIAQAIDIYTELSKTDPEEHEPNMAAMYTILGDNNIDRENYSVALIQHEEAARIRYKLAQHGSFVAKMNYADTLVKLSSLHLILKEYPECEKRYLDATSQLDQLLENNVYTVMELKAMAAHNYVGFLIETGQYKAALKLAKETVEMRQYIQDIDLFGKLPAIIDDHETVAYIYGLLKDPEGILRERKTIVTLYKTLHDHHPDGRFLEALGEAVNLRSNAFGMLDQMDDLIRSTREALVIFRELEARDSGYESVIGVLVGRLSCFYYDLGTHREEMLAAAREAYDLLLPIQRDKEGENIFEAVKEILRDNN